MIEYDYGARFYDAALARFHNLDPKAENYSFHSPFVYGANNPIKYIDKNGESPYLPFLTATAANMIDKKMNAAGFSVPEKNVAFTNLRGAYKSRKDFQTARNVVNNLGDANLISGRTEGAGNALRHSLWMALVTQNSDENFARDMGIAHEDGHPDDNPNQRPVDLENNELGIQVGLDNPNASMKELAITLLDKISEGEALVLDFKTGQITKSTLNSKDNENAKNGVNDLYNKEGQTAEQDLSNENK